MWTMAAAGDGMRRSSWLLLIAALVGSALPWQYARGLGFLSGFKHEGLWTAALAACALASLLMRARGRAGADRWLVPQSLSMLTAAAICTWRGASLITEAPAGEWLWPVVSAGGVLGVAVAAAWAFAAGLTAYAKSG